MAQDYEVLKPKNIKAYFIPCNEWDALKKQLESLTTEPWFFHNTGYLLLGAALPTLIAILTGAISTTTVTNAEIIAWAVVMVCTICGVMALYFAHKDRGIYRDKAQNVLTQMRLIEERF
jgi:hypothetical protein